MREEKAVLRTEAKDRRATAFARHGTGASTQLAQHGLGFAGIKQGAVISGFSAINDEINPSFLMLKMHDRGHRLALPTMQGKGKPLVFRSYEPGDEVKEALWGIAEPLPSAPAVEPDVLLVPLLAFDVQGFRLGYGGGFYDRTLRRLRAMKPIIAIGVGYDEQRVNAVPHFDYDERLDWVLTPSGPLRCAGTH
jgi:5-formyltetrahydrofolate cyclo-ligase